MGMMTFATPAKPPTKRLFQHIKRREWDRARFRTLTYPWDAHFRRTENNVTPMHMVCLHRAPIDVVQLLLDANPGALFAQDSEGWTPIHLVLLYGGDEDVAVLMIRRGGASAASLLSPIAGSPLHVACRHDASIRVLEELIKANLAMATTANENGAKPAEVVWRQFVRNPENKSLTLLQGKNNSTSSSCHSSLDDLVKKLTLLLQAAKQEEVSCCDSMLMHELLTHQMKLGDLTGFLEMAVHLFPEQVEIRNDSGDYLLHIAASLSESSTRQYGGLEGGLKDSVDILLSAFPSAASFANRSGDLPLHLSLRKGKRKWKTGVSSLVEAYSDAVCVRDRETNLYPFQLAALSLEEGENLECLETIFELLLAAPHVLRD